MYLIIHFYMHTQVQVTAATGFKANSTEVTVVIMEDLVGKLYTIVFSSSLFFTLPMKFWMV